MSIREPMPPPPAPLVLIVDDYRDCCEMYRTYLALRGFDVVTASSGVEALRIAADVAPDVILMDLSLPGLDGYEVTRQLKALPATRSIPVIALTAQSPSPLEQMTELGFEATIIKPCLPDTLAAEVDRIIRLTIDRLPDDC